MADPEPPPASAPAPHVLRRNAIAMIGRALERHGLTAFDLLSWTGLLNLWRMTSDSSALDVFSGHEIRKELAAALHRKAALLDAEQRTDFHVKLLGSFRIELF